MNLRYRIVAIALGAYLIFVLFPNKTLAQNNIVSSGDGSSIEDTCCQQTYWKRDNSDKSALPIKIIKDREEINRTESRDASSYELQKQNLAAQEAMVEATNKIVNVSWRQVALSGMSVIGLILSLSLSIYALTVTRRIGQAQVRAYISCDGGTFNFNDDDGGLWIDASIKNTGQSPAKIVEISEAILSYYDNGRLKPFSFCRAMTICPSISASGTEIAQIFFDEINKDEFQSAKNITVNITVRWLDVFDCWDSVEYRLSKKDDKFTAHKC